MEELECVSLFFFCCSMQEYIPRAYFRWLCNSLNSSFSSLLSATILCMYLPTCWHMGEQ